MLRLKDDKSIDGSSLGHIIASSFAHGVDAMETLSSSGKMPARLHNFSSRTLLSPA